MWLLVALLWVVEVSGEEELLDRIVAVVDREIILLSEVKQRARLELFQKGKYAVDDSTLRALEERILDDMIADRIILVKAQKDSTLEVTPEEVDRALDEQLSRIRREAGSQQAYEQLLRKEGLTEKDLRKRFRKEVRDYLLKQKFMAKLARKVRVSDDEVRKFYRAYRDSFPVLPERADIAYILIKPKVGERRLNQVRSKAVRLLRQVRNGANFAALAEAYSEDPGSRRRGGDLGYLERGATKWPKFERVAFSLKPGGADTVRTPLGYHVILVEDREKDRVHVRHILLGLSPSSEDTARALTLLDSLRERALSGEDFEELVERYSEDPAGRRSGWRPVEQLPKVITDAISVLTPGQISRPFKGLAGCYLVKLYDRRPGGIPDLERDWDIIKEWAFERKLQREFEDLISEEKKRLYVEVRWDGHITKPLR